ncbi:MAG: CHAD domain-containing protein [Planctomycetota bacterium]|nr:CHAD domain-containing protein [Planctomycetota bacterium]
MENEPQPCNNSLRWRTNHNRAIIAQGGEHPRWRTKHNRLSNRLRSNALPKKQGRKKTTHIPSVRNALERFENRGRRPIRDLNALHDYRIQAKQLRYTLEWARPDLPKKPTTEVLKELKRIQNHLGAINDHATAIAILSQEKKGLKKQLRREKRMLKLAFERWIEFWNPERRLKFYANTRSLIQTQLSPVQPAPFDINLKFR